VPGTCGGCGFVEVVGGADGTLTWVWVAAGAETPFVAESAGGETGCVGGAELCVWLGDAIMIGDGDHRSRGRRVLRCCASEVEMVGRATIKRGALVQ
jgi:hypothetical protein